MYDYETAIYEDVKARLKETFTKKALANFITEDLAQYIQDEYWADDSVTGNGSGSYTFNTWKAGENLAGNLELAREALEEMGYNYLDLENLDEEYLDVTIRCYLLVYKSYDIAAETIYEAREELTER